MKLVIDPRTTCFEDGLWDPFCVSVVEFVTSLCFFDERPRMIEQPKVEKKSLSECWRGVRNRESEERKRHRKLLAWLLKKKGPQ